MMPATNRRELRTPFAMKEYQPSDRAAAVKFNEAASTFFDQALHARRRSDRYILLTVLFASVSFLGGISTKLRTPFHLIMVSFGAVVLTGAAILIFSSRLSRASPPLRMNVLLRGNIALEACMSGPREKVSSRSGRAAIREIFEKFNWHDVSDHMIAEWQDKIAKGRF